MNKPLSGKKILITAGPTWMALDKVRIITNIFTGNTGCLIAHTAAQMGGKVTLLLGPGQTNFPKDFFNGITVLRFTYFQDLFDLIKNKMRSKKYNIVIHSAAISDYMPTNIYKGKIKSSQKKLKLDLKPTPKIIAQIKKYTPTAFLVAFKLEIKETKKTLIKLAKNSFSNYNSDLVVTNNYLDMSKKKNQAYIIDRNLNVSNVKNRKNLAKILLNIITKKIS